MIVSNFATIVARRLATRKPAAFVQGAGEAQGRMRPDLCVPSGLRAFEEAMR